MTFTQQLKAGSGIVKQSFSLLWRNKKLMLYTALAALFFAITTAAVLYLRVANLLSIDSLMDIINIRDNVWSNPVFVFALHLCVVLVKIFMGVALSYHAYQIMEKKKTSIGQAFKVSMSKIIFIIALSLIISVFHKMPGGLLWQWLTMLLIPTIAIGKNPLGDFIKNTSTMVKKHTWESLSIVAIFALILSIVVMLVKKAFFALLKNLISGGLKSGIIRKFIKKAGLLLPLTNLIIIPLEAAYIIGLTMLYKRCTNSR